MKYKAGDKVLLHTYKYLNAKYPREEGSGYIYTGIEQRLKLLWATTSIDNY